MFYKKKLKKNIKISNNFIKNNEVNISFKKVKNHNKLDYLEHTDNLNSIIFDIDFIQLSSFDYTKQEEYIKNINSLFKTYEVKFLNLTSRVNLVDQINYLEQRYRKLISVHDNVAKNILENEVQNLEFFEINTYDDKLYLQVFFTNLTELEIIYTQIKRVFGYNTKNLKADDIKKYFNNLTNY